MKAGSQLKYTLSGDIVSCTFKLFHTNDFKDFITLVFRLIIVIIDSFKCFLILIKE